MSLILNQLTSKLEKIRESQNFFKNRSLNETIYRISKQM